MSVTAADLKVRTALQINGVSSLVGYDPLAAINAGGTAASTALTVQVKAVAVAIVTEKSATANLWIVWSTSIASQKS